jgi:hypothetical protein
MFLRILNIFTESSSGGIVWFKNHKSINNVNESGAWNMESNFLCCNSNFICLQQQTLWASVVSYCRNATALWGKICLSAVLLNKQQKLSGQNYGFKFSDHFAEVIPPPALQNKKEKGDILWVKLFLFLKIQDIGHLKIAIFTMKPLWKNVFKLMQLKV